MCVLRPANHYGYIRTKYNMEIQRQVNDSINMLVAYKRWRKTTTTTTTTRATHIHTQKCSVQYGKCNATNQQVILGWRVGRWGGILVSACRYVRVSSGRYLVKCTTCITKLGMVVTILSRGVFMVEVTVGAYKFYNQNMIVCTV